MKYLFLLFIVCMVVISFVQGANINIELDEIEYGPGDEIFVKAILISENESLNGKFILKSTINSLVHNSDFIEEYVNLNKEQEKEIYFRFYVPEVLEQGSYDIIATYESFDNSNEVKEVKTIYVFNTSKIFDFKINLNKKVIKSGESLDLDYHSSVYNPLISAVLTYPNGDEKEIELPYSFTAKDIGTYTLEVSASKEGYKDAVKTEQFAVIEKNAEIENVSLFSADDLNNYVEEKTNDDGKNFDLIFIILPLIILLIVFLVWFFIRGNSKEKTSE